MGTLMVETVLDREQARALSYGSRAEARKALGVTSNGPLYKFQCEIRRVRVAALRGRTPEVWWSLDGCLLVANSGRIVGGDLNAQWEKAKQGQAQPPAMLRQIASAREKGYVTTGVARDELRRLTGLPLPRRVMDEVADILPSLPGSEFGLGRRYRVWKLEDVVEAATKVAERYASPELPSELVSFHEAAEMLGCTISAVQSAEDEKLIEADRSRTPMALVRSSVDYYAGHRAPITKAAKAYWAARDLYGVRDAARMLGITPNAAHRAIAIGALKVDRTIPGLQRTYRLISGAEINRVARSRPLCGCGCGEAAWPWQRLLHSHHMKVPVRLTVDRALHLAVERVQRAGRGEDGEWNSEFLVWARGLCERRRRYALDLRRRSDGARISEPSLRMDAQIVAALALEPEASRSFIAGVVGITPRHYDKRKRDLEAAAVVHPAACRACNKRLNTSRLAVQEAN